jgi:2-haloacid dehalogenase
MARHALYVFDAYGTLFDVHSAVGRYRGEIGPQADRLSDLWRTKQLEYTWVRTLTGAYRDFQALTEEALDYAAARCGAGLSPALRDSLLRAYETLEGFPDVRTTLAALKQGGARTAILSNGTPAMLEAATTSAGICDWLDATLSVDALRRYKTVPEVYEMVTRQFGVRRDEVSFQSSNRWDIAGATAFGFHTVWINRGGLPDEYADLPPSEVLPSLAGLAT